MCDQRIMEQMACSFADNLPGDEEREVLFDECKIIDTEPDEAFDRITALAARVLKVSCVANEGAFANHD